MCLAIPVRITEVVDQDRARASIGGIVREICITLVGNVQPGDHVILHVGYALSKLDEEAAQRTLETMRTAGVLEETLAELTRETS
ncbi:MAG: HypC/HybG/HupF family hydrogenase formation chaperone [Pseudomonadales bacterium]|jgi:hydrogenase expression/formation protein HypC|nr:HypC/HybG/HupF family hydrogenase formation chaperone [Pseudomonadales bacterium]